MKRNYCLVILFFILLTVTPPVCFAESGVVSLSCSGITGTLSEGEYRLADEICVYNGDISLAGNVIFDLHGNSLFLQDENHKGRRIVCSEGSSCSLTIRDTGTERTGGLLAASISGPDSVTISGGHVNVTGTDSGISAGTAIRLGWMDAENDFIYADRYEVGKGGRITAEGRFAAYDGETVTEIIREGTIEAADINGKTLRPLPGYCVRASGGVTAVAPMMTAVTGEDTLFCGYTERVTLIPPETSSDWKKMSAVSRTGGESLGISADRSVAIPDDDVTVTAAAVPVSIDDIEEQPYMGGAAAPAVTVRDMTGGTEKILTKDTDYTPVYRDNTGAGKASVLVTGAGAYVGTSEKFFTITKNDYPGAIEAAVSVWSSQPMTGVNLGLPVLPAGAYYKNIVTVTSDPQKLLNGEPAVREGVLTFSTTARSRGTKAVLKVGAAGGNYNDFEVTITLTASGPYPSGNARLYPPSGITDIGNSAFEGTGFFDEAVLPQGLLTIGSRAFADCAELRLVHIPDSVHAIAEDAFENTGDLIFYCSSDNIGAAHARRHGIPYQFIP